jgi:precorrin-6A/cobalt-precorrin-6A reductase
MKYLVLAGTSDGRLLAEELQARGHEVMLSALTDYGAEIAQTAGLEARCGALNQESFLLLLRRESFTAVIDATHPFAVQIRGLAQSVCLQTGTPNFRWQRDSLQDLSHPLLHWQNDIASAAADAAQLGKRILLTTGSKTLPLWLADPELVSKTLFVRVLPTSAILRQCEALGLKPFQIIAAQGPFSQAWNEAIIRQLAIDVVVAKDSGRAGGTLEKIQACLNLQVPLVLLRRLEETSSLTLTKFIELVEGSNAN